MKITCVSLAAVFCFGLPAEEIALFNGKDLEGWVIDCPGADADASLKTKAFSVAKNVIRIGGEPRGELRTEKEYADFRLEIEYRYVGKAGESGLMIHATEPRATGKLWSKCIEVQMNSGDAGDFWLLGHQLNAPDKEKRQQGPAIRIPNLTDDSEKAVGEWNVMVVECRGAGIHVTMNGTVVNVGTECSVSKGRIAFQSEGSSLELRKVVLTPLEKK